jgi:inner membrane transporter RhtA
MLTAHPAHRRSWWVATQDACPARAAFHNTWVWPPESPGCLKPRGWVDSHIGTTDPSRERRPCRRRPAALDAIAHPRHPVTRRVPAPLLVLAAVISVQFGAAVAATLIPLVGVFGAVTLRFTFAATLLLVIVRPRLRGRTTADWLVVGAFGAILAMMNLFFYGALARIPIGVAVTIEFTGPLVLATVLSHRRKDLLAVVGAGLGVVLISGITSTPWAQIDLAGLGLALAAGVAWAGYIVFSARTGVRFAQLDGLAIAMTIAALLVAPVGMTITGSALWAPNALWRGVTIAVLSSVLPYSLELIALRRLAAHVFGILLSLEPAVAALAGLVVLGQQLSAPQVLGMACVVAASGLVMGRRSVPSTPEALAETTNQ